MKTEAPWYKYYGDVPATLDYPDYSMYNQILSSANKYPDYKALDFMGTALTYSEMIDAVNVAAKGFCALGVKSGDRVTICLPNTPHAVICFYAVNLMGAVANMIHPLSSEGEIEFYLRDSGSRVAITLDQFYDKFKNTEKKYKLKKLIIASVTDYMNPFTKIGYKLTLGRKIKPVCEEDNVILWKNFVKLGENFEGEYKNLKKGKEAAVILYSGGTTGTTKGILLSNLNFNALAIQTATMGNLKGAGLSMLAVLPVFHGFGLGVCIHTILSAGCRCILIPRFNAESYAKLLRTKKPNYIAGVPTLYEAILRNPDMDGVDLSCLRGVFSGGDSLSAELKKRFDKFLFDHNSPVPVREGYGTTECVTASCLTPQENAREGSIGIPFPDTFYSICNPETNEELPYGTEGEICISGPTVMIEYVGHPEETKNTLRVHKDGRTWLHTGDLGIMDEDGFIYFRQRMKRMIVTSGYNVYPSQIENVLDGHPAVQMSCVIGVPDPYKMQKVKAFIMLKPGVKFTPEVKNNILEHCRKNVAKYAMPYDIEARDQLPKTLVGKVAYKVLEQEELNKIDENVAPGESAVVSKS